MHLMIVPQSFRDAASSEIRLQSSCSQHTTFMSRIWVLLACDYLGSRRNGLQRARTGTGIANRENEDIE